MARRWRVPGWSPPSREVGTSAFPRILDKDGRAWMADYAFGTQRSRVQIPAPRPGKTHRASEPPRPETLHRARRTGRRGLAVLALEPTGKRLAARCHLTGYFALWMTIDPPPSTVAGSAASGAPCWLS